jgi:cytidyltransferase-like protein
MYISLNPCHSQELIDDVLAVIGVEDLYEFYAKWSESHRYFHNLDHLYSIVMAVHDKYKNDEHTYVVYMLAAMFHDIVYEPNRTDNEVKSVEVFNHYVNPLDLSKKTIDEVCSLILATADMNDDNDFNQMDRKILTETSISKLIDYEHKIAKEYQYLDYPTYKKNRIEFLTKCLTKYPNLAPLIDYVQNRKISVGCYFGTFNPFHVGHYNILEKANKLFDKVVVVLGMNPDKSYDHTMNTRLTTLKNTLKYYEVDDMGAGTQVHYMNNMIASGMYSLVTAIKGLRNERDLVDGFESEYWSKKLGNYNVVYLSCDEQYKNVSSRGINMLNRYDARKAEQLIFKPK